MCTYFVKINEEIKSHSKEVFPYLVLLLEVVLTGGMIF